MVMNITMKLTETINDLGNALTAAEWPVKARNAVHGDTKIYDTKEIYKDLVFEGIKMQNMENDFLDCVNELCLKCGNYREAHNGACNWCRWKDVKEGFR